MMKFDTLYKLDSLGKIREWTIEQNFETYRVISGIKDGNLVTSGWKTAIPTNVGRSNERNASAQAYFEATALYKKQKESGYTEDIEKVKSGQSTKTFFEPTLCQRYSTWKFNKAYSQPKLDGIRCIATAKGLFSRSGKQIVSCPHIEKSLAPLFAKVPGLALDGELYNHDFKDNFDTLTSLIRKTKLTPDDYAESEKYIQYHMYDSPSVFGGFELRLAGFKTFNESAYPGIKFTETVLITSSLEADQLMEEYLVDGYEGQIIRLFGQPYEEGKRSNYLLKRKLLYENGGEEGEFIVRGIEEGKGNWAGKAKAIWFETADGQPFKATLKGGMLTAKTVYDDRDKYINNSKATVVYQNLTPKGKPRFGTVKELDRWDI